MTETRDGRPAWSADTWLALISLTLGSFAVVSSELLPMGMLTPLARDLGVSEGVAGQTVTLTAIFAGLPPAPTIALIIGCTDRKHVMLAVTGLGVASNLLAAALDLRGVQAPLLITAGCSVLAALLVLARAPTADTAPAAAE